MLELRGMRAATVALPAADVLTAAVARLSGRREADIAAELEQRPSIATADSQLQAPPRIVDRHPGTGLLRRRPQAAMTATRRKKERPSSDADLTKIENVISSLRPGTAWSFVTT